VISEASLAATIKAYLEQDGWTTYQEVCLSHAMQGKHNLGSRADIVATRDGQIAVVECKLSLSFDLLRQAKQWQPFANIVWIAFPESKRTPGRNEACSIARDRGFGILEVRDDRIHPWGSPRVQVEIDDALLVSLRPGHQTAAPAGTNRGGHFTSFAESCEHLAQYVAIHPGCKLAEAVSEIRHHYASKSSAMGGFTRAIKKGWVANVYSGWKQGLYPTPQNPTQRAITSEDP
jgi:hypothetical protein